MAAQQTADGASLVQDKASGACRAPIVTDDRGIRLIDAAELKEKLDRGDDFKLVNALGDWEFRAKHIPGSLHLQTISEAVEHLDRDDEIVVYCSNPSCRASVKLYRELVKAGYRNVRRFAGGIAGWEEAGYPLEGEWLP